MTFKTYLEPPLKWPTPVKIIFSDIDDTLTWNGRLPAETYVALHQLKEAGVIVIPVTGASAGWCDCIIRTWPIDTVIVENGSFWLTRNEQGLVSKHFCETPQNRKENKKRLLSLGELFHQQYPDIDYTQDQHFRMTDIAFDIGQQVSIPRKRAQEATQWWLDQGVMARFSSIHINVWIGDYDKAFAALKCLESYPDISQNDCVFIGDSPNDEAMFKAFPQSVGVQNIVKFLNDMDHHPHSITRSNGGYGFAELANSILNGR